MHLGKPLLDADERGWEGVWPQEAQKAHGGVGMGVTAKYTAARSICPTDIIEALPSEVTRDLALWRGLGGEFDC